jgi:hypothetical protein
MCTTYGAPAITSHYRCRSKIEESDVVATALSWPDIVMINRLGFPFFFNFEVR